MTSHQHAREALGELVVRIASREPVPAGGAAAAGAVAQGAALLAKCVRIARREADGQVSIEALDAISAKAVDAFSEDCEAFERVLQARRDGAGRAAAWIGATEAPLELAELALDALALSGAVRARAKRATLPDVRAAEILLNAGLDIALGNARANVGLVRDDEAEDRLRSRIEAAAARTTARGT